MKRDHMFRLDRTMEAMKRLCLLPLGAALLCPPLHTQPIPVQEPQDRFADPSARQLFYEAINFPSDTPGLSRLDILYRVDLSFFVAIRNPNGVGQPEFLRHGEIVVELIDSLGLSRARDTDVLAEESSTSESTAGLREWHQGIMSFNVQPGIYTLAISVTDRESDRGILERRKTARAKAFPTDQPAVSTPFLALWSDTMTTPERLFPQNFGGGAKFGEKSTCVMSLTNKGDRDSVRVEYTITRAETTRAESTQVPFSNSGHVRIFRGYRLNPVNGHEAAYALTPSSSRDVVVIAPFSAEKLPLHEYVLRMIVHSDEFNQTLSVKIGLVWPEMPPPLRSFQYALESLRYVTTKKELDSLDRGSDIERRRKFESFWAARDRTPETAYNEVMTEYYTRVDHAARTFSTLRQDDGSKTDRGRIYILYGPPAATERKLDPTGYVEVWSYPNIGKRFLFLDEAKTGDYHLTSTQPL